MKGIDGQSASGCVRGIGLGLRSQHAREIITTRPSIPWFEVLTDNYFGPGGLPLSELEAIAELYPITMHSVGMSVGSTDPLDFDYLDRIRSLRDRFRPAWISEHLCWTSVHGVHLHDLCPLPYTEETVRHVAGRISEIQDYLGERILIENVSSYISYNHSTLTEWEFISEVVRKADCDLLLDINNIYVSSVNHTLDAHHYIQHLPKERVRELHLGGFEDRNDHLLDSHSAPVHEAVWDLYRFAIETFGAVPTLLEWDNDIPSLDALLLEASRATEILGATYVNEQRSNA